MPAINEKTCGHAATASVISALRAFLWRSRLSKFRRVLLAVCCCSLAAALLELRALGSMLRLACVAAMAVTNISQKEEVAEVQR